MKRSPDIQVIDLGDSMTFDPIPGQADSLTCNVADIPTDDSNLVLKVCFYTIKQVLLRVDLDMTAMPYAYCCIHTDSSTVFCSFMLTWNATHHGCASIAHSVIAVSIAAACT